MSGESWVLSGTKRIPKRFKSIIKNFEKLSQEKLEKLLQIYIGNLPEDTELTYKTIMKDLDLDQESAIELIYDSLSIYMTYIRSGDSIKEFLENNLYDKIRDFLKDFLKLDKSLGIKAKIAYLEIENPNIIVSTHIITDFRPIYFKDPLMELKYGLIKHTLSFTFRETGEFKDIFFTLDRDNLKELSRLIERALNKEKTLEESCKKNDIRIFKGMEL